MQLGFGSRFCKDGTLLWDARKVWVPILHGHFLESRHIATRPHYELDTYELWLQYQSINNDANDLTRMDCRSSPLRLRFRGQSTGWLPGQSTDQVMSYPVVMKFQDDHSPEAYYFLVDPLSMLL